MDEEPSIVHETLEQLLGSHSPAYRLASQQALFSRLHEFVNTRTDQGNLVGDSVADDDGGGAR